MFLLLSRSKNISFFAFLLALFLSSSALAQPRAVLVDGDGPWINDRWTFAVSEFRGLLTDAGYTVTVVSPADLAGALTSTDILVAVPSLESLPVAAFNAIATHVGAGGGLMATGGEPFLTPLYRAPDGRWLDSDAYKQAVGSAPPGKYTRPSLVTLSPAKEQYVTSTGLRIPVMQNRGVLSGARGRRYRVIGDLAAPVATIWSALASPLPAPGQTLSTFWQPFVVWLPWPQVLEPLRSQLVTALRGAPARVFIQSAGSSLMTWMPNHAVTGTVSVMNTGSAAVQALLEWSVVGPSGTAPQPTMALPLAKNEKRTVPFQLEGLASGEYKLQFRLLSGTQELDRVESRVRVLDPVLTRQPDQKIRIRNGGFEIGGRHVFLRGLNYQPSYINEESAFNGHTWLEPSLYDPEMIESDLTQIAALGFNVVHVQYFDVAGVWAEAGPSLMDFLERCRIHGLWAQIALTATATGAAYAGQLSPKLEPLLQSAYLPGNDRVFAYELLWEPSVGTHDQGGPGRLVNGAVIYNKGRLVLDEDWRAWVDEQYGSRANAEKAWGFVGPVDAAGLLTNPLDDQIQSDGPWRVMVAAYRRFLDDYLGRNLGTLVRQIRRTDPDTLITYRNGSTMTAAHNRDAGYDIGAGAAHLDFVSPERYLPTVWPESRNSGLVTAYSHYRNGGKPVYWAEYGTDIGPNGGTVESRAGQDAIC